MNRLDFNTSPPYYNEEEWRVISEAFNHYATNISPLAATMRSLPNFESIKKYKGSLRIKLADMRYLYLEALDEHAKVKSGRPPRLQNHLANTQCR